MLIRIRSRDGLERVTVGDNATIGDLKYHIWQQLSIPVQDQVLSIHKELLLGKPPQEFTDMVDSRIPLHYLRLGHGSVVFLLYSGERSVSGPPVAAAGSFGRKMTMDDLIAKQTRIERQENPICSSVSFDRNSAHAFQLYVHETLAFSVKRCGFMFGSVTEDKVVRVEFIYEPPQEGTSDSFQIIRDSGQEMRVKCIADGLGLQWVGFIFNQSMDESSKDYTMSNLEIQQAAALHAESGNDTFVTAIVKLEPNQEGSADVHFEAFQLSEQCVKLYKDGWFVNSPETNPKLSKMKDQVVLAGKDTTEVDNDFFIVPVKIADHQGLLSSTFPVENRLITVNATHLRAHLDRTKGQSFVNRISDFHLLFFLSAHLDLLTDIPQLAEAVRIKGPVPEGYLLIIESL